jgi:hypothetical protein
MKIMLKNKRQAFPALAKPQAIGDGEPAYGNRLIIDPEDPDVKVLDDAILAVAKEKWKEDGAAILKMLKEDKKVCFVHGPYYNKKKGVPYDGFEGKFNLAARRSGAKDRPTCLDKFGKKITEPSDIDRILYSGCMVNQQVEIWAQDNNFGRRINCDILGVMFAGDGPSFGGGSAVADADDFASMAAKPEDDPEAGDYL